MLIGEFQSDMVMKEIETVKEAAEMVWAELLDGHDEDIYEKALAIEFEERGLIYSIEKNTLVMYKGHPLGLHRHDFVVEEKLVVELKVGTKIQAGHKAQVKGYLRSSGIETGLLINMPGKDIAQTEVEFVVIHKE